ncbi:hypothetical protein IQ215_10705 [Cyanobacterium stanieri LEGE 03274]|uniref:Uncharacterized protein n=1 Tax=Cyanobacterium stanieri LEGE 03274 TaxID=1828756 RepID=A0ABR9V5J8_9CHRO|nr:hypothetical protein [Cyanobacterium stanieri]MBE9223165.1 hypothetical protein [Cyanobacterium stanieri LEGE 03274]
MNSPQDLPEKLRHMDWYAIACKVRVKYEKLKEKVTYLEQSLLGYQKEVEGKDKIINEQNRQLDNHGVTLNQLYIKVDDATQQINHQQLLIEKLSQDLKDSQTQRGRIERECSLLQESYNQLQYRIRDRERENQELNVRLQRQQRTTLEYKAALDKYLHSSTDKPKMVSTEKDTIKSWSEISKSKDDSSISPLSNFTIAPVPNFVNIPLVDDNKKPMEDSPQVKDNTTQEPVINNIETSSQEVDNLEMEKQEVTQEDNTQIKEDRIVSNNVDISEMQPDKVKDNNTNEVSQSLEDKIIKKNMDLSLGIKPPKQNHKDQKIIIDLPDFFKNKRDNS